MSIAEDITVAILLNSLPSTYDPLIMAMDVVGEEKLQLDSVISKLKNTKVTEKNTVDALNVNKKKFAKAKFKGKCHACGKIGHKKKDCYVAKETALMVTNQKEEGIIDSGASVHMTVRQNNKIKVVIPNGLEISSSLIGSAKLGNISLKKVLFHLIIFMCNSTTVCPGKMCASFFNKNGQNTDYSKNEGKRN
jgi:hypothetical protein